MSTSLHAWPPCIPPGSTPPSPTTRAVLQSDWADLFIRYHKFWGGEPTAEDLSLIYTRKPRPPYREVEHPDGTTEKVWCTFDYEQIDIDAFNPLGLSFIEDQLDTLTSKCAPAATSPSCEHRRDVRQRPTAVRVL